jgi:hypothetical protein
MRWPWESAASQGTNTRSGLALRLPGGAIRTPQRGSSSSFSGSHRAKCKSAVGQQAWWGLGQVGIWAGSPSRVSGSKYATVYSTVCSTVYSTVGWPDVANELSKKAGPSPESSTAQSFHAGTCSREARHQVLNSKSVAWLATGSVGLKFVHPNKTPHSLVAKKPRRQRLLNLK